MASLPPGFYGSRFGSCGGKEGGVRGSEWPRPPEHLTQRWRTSVRSPQPGDKSLLSCLRPRPQSTIEMLTGDRKVTYFFLLS
jgi:hypothetical protein